MATKINYDEEARRLLAGSKGLRQVYTGDLAIGVTWATIVGRHRDSGLLEQSNFDTIKNDLEESFPNDVEVASFGHFAVGWIEELLVRMIDDQGAVTPAGTAAITWKLKLENYPVADEDDFSRREYEATVASTPDAVRDILRGEQWSLRDFLPDGWGAILLQEVEYDSDDGWPRFRDDAAVIDALIRLGFVEREGGV
jgi:hypothetical protein